MSRIQTPLAVVCRHKKPADLCGICNPVEEPQTSDEVIPGFLGPIPDGEVWFTIKIKPSKGILRVFHHLGNGRGQEAPVVFTEVGEGLRKMIWLLKKILESK
jgi:hypothetical protein